MLVPVLGRIIASRELAVRFAADRERIVLHDLAATEPARHPRPARGLGHHLLFGGRLLLEQVEGILDAIEVPAAALEHREHEPASVLGPGDGRARRDDAGDPGEDVGQLEGLAGRDIHDVDVRDPGAIGDEGELRPVRRPLGIDVLPLLAGQDPDLIGAQVIEAEPELAELERAEVGAWPAIGGESDGLAVGRPLGIAVGEPILGQPPDFLAVERGDEEIRLATLLADEHHLLPVGREARALDPIQTERQLGRHLLAIDVEADRPRPRRRPWRRRPGTSDWATRRRPSAGSGAIRIRRSARPRPASAGPCRRSPTRDTCRCTGCDRRGRPSTSRPATRTARD